MNRPPPIPLIILTNGRDCIHETIASARENLDGTTGMIIVDDSGDATRRKMLEERYGCEVFFEKDQAVGYSRAMTNVWNVARSFSNGIFFLEDDFTFNEPVALYDLAKIQALSNAVQVALVRQPWFRLDKLAGGLLQKYRNRGSRMEERSHEGLHWVEHQIVFTCNPCYIPASTFRHNWPIGTYSEPRMARRLFSRGLSSAFYGKIADAPRVHHIGTKRTGFGY